MTWRILTLLLPRDLRQSIAGDLQEEYGRMLSRHSRLYAEAWACWTAIRLALTFCRENLLHGRPLPPIRDEIRRKHSMWDSIRQDIGYATRMLRRQPGFTAVAFLALTLGIGANTAIFSIVDAVLWRPLPYPDADNVVSLAEQRPREGRPFGPVSPADYFDWRKDSQSFSAMAAYSERTANLTGNGEPERLRGLSVSPGFFSVLGIAPLRGRDFRLEEETQGQHRVVLLTDGLWRRRFGGDTGIVGRTIALDGNSYEVIGILPPGFWWRSPLDIVVPLALDAHDRTLRAAHFLDIVAHLRPNMTLAQARQELMLIGDRLTQTYPGENTGHGPNIRQLRETLVGEVRQPLLILLAAVGFVLLIACANVATLLLARASGRQKELSVRRAVGASRGRLVQQMLTESILVSLIGGAVGVLLAAWSLSVFRTALPAQFSGLPGIENIAIDLRVLIAATLISAATGLMFGVVPAFVASHQRLGIALNDEARGSSGSARTQRLRSALVVAELALSLILLVGASLLIVSFNKLMNVSPGFQSGQLIAAQISLPGSRYPDQPRAAVFFERLYDRLRSVPGIQRVAATSAAPFSGVDARLNLEFESHTIESSSPVRVHPRFVSWDYMPAMGIPLIRGRQFNERDTTNAPSVVLINEAASRRYWPGEDPLGQRISMGDPAQWREIVGIVGNIRHQALETDAEPEAFIPQLQTFFALGNSLGRSMTVVIRTTADTATLAPLLRAAISEIDSQQPIGSIRPMDDLIAESIAPRRLNFILVSAFAFVAVLLTAAGLYGVMSYLVVQRTREIGVRMALGATRGQVLGLMIRQAGTMTLIGIVLGIAGALQLTRSMGTMLFGIQPADPVVYAGVSVLLAAVALSAVAVPSARATRVDPLKALRDS